MRINLGAIGVDNRHRLLLGNVKCQCGLAAGRRTGNKRQSFAPGPVLRIRHDFSFFHKYCHTDSG